MVYKSSIYVISSVSVRYLLNGSRIFDYLGLAFLDYLGPDRVFDDKDQIFE